MEQGPIGRMKKMGGRRTKEGLEIGGAGKKRAIESGRKTQKEKEHSTGDWMLSPSSLSFREKYPPKIGNRLPPRQKAANLVAHGGPCRQKGKDATGTL